MKVKDLLPSVEFARLVDVAQKAAAIIGIFAAGYLFFSRYENLPRANISHKFTSLCLASDRRLIRAEVMLENKGNERIRLGDLVYQWNQVLPLSNNMKVALTEDGYLPVSENTVVAWPRLFSRRVPLNGWLEAGESQTIDIDYVARASIKVIELLTYFDNQAAVESIGWKLRSLYSVPVGENCT